MKTKKSNLSNRLDFSLEKIVLPDEILESQVKSRRQEVEKNIQQYGMDLEGYLSTVGQSEEDFMNGLKETARKEATNYFILDAVLKAENIEVSNEEVEFEIAKLADQYNMTVDKVKEALANSMNEFVNNLRMNRVEDLLISNND